MYIILNRTKKETIAYEGNYPYNALVYLLEEEEDDILVISTYSNTIKIPYLMQVNGISELECREFSLPDNLINPDFKI